MDRSCRQIQQKKAGSRIQRPRRRLSRRLTGHVLFFLLFAYIWWGGPFTFVTFPLAAILDGEGSVLAFLLWGGGGFGGFRSFLLAGVGFSGRFVGGSVDIDDLLRLSGDLVLRE